jgi:hypothetical protein
LHPGWAGFFVPRRLAAVSALAAVVVAAFLIGRWTTPHPAVEGPVAADKVRERVLVVAVGQHLGKSEMVLMEFENAQPDRTGRKLVNISAEQRRAEDLLDENRLYRQTALQSGDKIMASTLDELERTLLDIANSPKEVTPARFEAMRKRIESQGILFKVRVVHQDLRERQKPAKPSPEKNDSTRKARNRV